MLTVDYDRLGVGPGRPRARPRLRVRPPRLRGGPPRRLGGGARRRPRRGGPGARHARRHGRGGRARPPATRRRRCRATRWPCPFADGTFDRVIASEVLEHIPDDVAAMRELARVLKPGGTMAVTVPRCVPEAVNWALSDEYHDTPGGHVRIYRRSTLSAAWLGRARADRVPPRPRPALALLVAALPGRAVQRHEPGRGRVPQGPGVGHRQGAVRDPRRPTGC